MSLRRSPGGRGSSRACCLLAWLMLAVNLAAAEPFVNLIPNPAFKDGLEQWQVKFPHANESKYNDNHEFAKVVNDPKRSGQAIEFTLSAKVAASEGVKASTLMVPVEKGVPYVFGADVYSEGPTPKIFIEGYKPDPEQLAEGDNQYKGFVRCYRAVIHVKNAGGQWATQKMVFQPPDMARFQPTHVMIKLYGYHPAGKLYFSNVYLRRTDEQPKKKAGERINPSYPKDPAKTK